MKIDSKFILSERDILDMFFAYVNIPEESVTGVLEVDIDRGDVEISFCHERLESPKITSEDITQFLREGGVCI